MLSICMSHITVFTDGACKNNNSKSKPRCAGVGVFFDDNSPLNLSQKVEGKLTNQRAELMACLRAIEIVSSNYSDFKLLIYSDSMYTINCVTKWAPNWIKNGWAKKGGPIENLDLIKPLYELTNQYNIMYHHINSHLHEPTDKQSEQYTLWYGNNEADRLANMACL